MIEYYRAHIYYRAQGKWQIFSRDRELKMLLLCIYSTPYENIVLSDIFHFLKSSHVK